MQYGHEHVGMVWYESLLPLVGGEGDDCLSVASLPIEREVYLFNMAYTDTCTVYTRIHVACMHTVSVLVNCSCYAQMTLNY